MYGTLSIFDTLDSQRVAAGDVINLYNPETLYRQIQAYFDAHNLLREQMIMELVADSTERLTTWGGTAKKTMSRGDEYSRPFAQKMSVTPVEMGFPLERAEIAWQVTKDFMETRTMGDLEKELIGIANADVEDTLTQIRHTLFNPTNNTSYIDHLTDSATLKLRALVNADSTPIPPTKYGTTFDGSTHTHYMGASSYTDTSLKSLITNVSEHYPDGRLFTYINAAQEDTTRGFTSGTTKFYPLVDGRLNLPNTDTVMGELDLGNTEDRPIGVFGRSWIWVKPWIPSGYLFCFSPDAPKPIRRRVRSAERGMLRLRAMLDSYPLHAEVMQREDGFAIYERTNGACLYTGNATYAAPAEWSFTN